MTLLINSNWEQLRKEDRVLIAQPTGPMLRLDFAGRSCLHGAKQHRQPPLRESYVNLATGDAALDRFLSRPWLQPADEFGFTDIEGLKPIVMEASGMPDDIWDEISSFLTPPIGAVLATMFGIETQVLRKKPVERSFAIPNNIAGNFSGGF